MKKILSYLCFLAALFTSCSEEFVGQPATSDTKPNPIVSCSVRNIPGGAVIYYKVPKDKDLLYVKCIYNRNGKECNSSASIYTDSLKVEGFPSENQQKVRLYCIDRNNNVSDPVEVDIHPQIPPIRTIGETFKMDAAFGGVKLNWKNETGSMMSFYFLARNEETNEMEVADIVYSNSKDGNYTLRGFNTDEREFWCYAKDYWNNYSDTIKGVYTPFYEKQVDSKGIKRVKLPADNITDNGSWWLFEKMFDGKILESGGWHTYEPSKPILFTIDLGAPTKLSRYIWWHVDPFMQHYNAKIWTMYGLKTAEELEAQRQEFKDDEDYWKEGFKSKWIKIMDCEAKTQSGSKSPTSDDINWVKNNGFQFDIPLDVEPVRYIRFWVQETWGSGKQCDMLMVSELQFWGSQE